MNKIIITFLLVVSLLFSGCITSKPHKVWTPLEIQSIQTRSYEGSFDIVFRSTISVFQDLGYTIKTADINTGFIQADSAANSNKSLKFWIGETETKQIKATGFVEKIGSKTQVRLNFVHSTESSTSYGASDRNQVPILDSNIYQNAFERIGNAIFMRLKGRAITD